MLSPEGGKPAIGFGRKDYAGSVPAENSSHPSSRALIYNGFIWCNAMFMTKSR
jgi:hypothetical protein